MVQQLTNCIDNYDNKYNKFLDYLTDCIDNYDNKYNKFLDYDNEE